MNGPAPTGVALTGTNRLLGPAAVAVAGLLRRRFGVTDPVVLLAGELTAFAHEEGHSCVDLTRVEEMVGEVLAGRAAGERLEPLPGPDEFLAALRAHPKVVREVSDSALPGADDAVSDRRPLVLLDNLVYSQRQFVDELSLARQLAGRAAVGSSPVTCGDLIDTVAPVPTDEESRKAGDDGIANRTLRSAVSSRITVLTGGPGTGKTHTLTRCIAVLLATREEQLADLSVALVAPTGKAATRAKELITAFVESVRSSSGVPGGLSDAVLDAMASIEPRTIHRLLGSVGGSQTRFGHHQTELLPHDIIVVDEMSMVPTHLMARLMEATRPDASVLLVGDHAQLESVESGSVLRGIIEPGPGGAPGRSWVFELRRVWRQSSDTRIGDLARLIRDGRSAEAVDLALTQPAGVRFVEAAEDGSVPRVIVADMIAAMERMRDLARGIEPEGHREAHGLLSRNKVLCGPRRGDLGVVEWNQHVRERVLGVVRPGEMVAGLPLLVTVNSPRARLVNGDIGLVVNHLDENGNVSPRVYFPGEDGGRYLTPAELPPVEECFAMTVHKSQGSEYENLVVILPRDGSPLLSRELIYTAVTRAKKSLVVAGTLSSFASAIDNRTVRVSALGLMITSSIGGSEQRE